MNYRPLKLEPNLKNTANSKCQNWLEQWFKVGCDLPPWQMSEDTFGCRDQGVLLAGGGAEMREAAKSLNVQESAPQQRIIWPKMLIVLKV